MKKTLRYYRRLPYTLRAEPQKDSDGTRYWTAEYLELRGCKTEGESESEAIANVQQLFDEYISTRIDNNLDIPEPEKIKYELETDIIVVRDKSTAYTVSDSSAEKTKMYQKEETPGNAQKTETTTTAIRSTSEETVAT